MTKWRYQPGTVCERCGVIHEPSGALNGAARCQKHNGTGTQCGLPALAGLDGCRLHSGRTKAEARAAGQQNLARERALGEVGQLIAQALEVVEAQTGPEQLQAAMDRAGAMALGYQWLLSELPVESLWSYEQHTSDSGSVQRFVRVEDAGLIGPDAQGVQKLHAYEEGVRYWTRLHGELLKVAASIGLEDRRQRILETHVHVIASVVRLVVAGLGRDLDDPEVVPVVQQALTLASGET